jgi:cardiolipin synthase
MMIWGLLESFFSTMVSWILLLAVVATIVVVVMDNRSPVKTLAWLLVLVF